MVFMIGSDPVEIGLIASLSRPSGNLTGVAYLNEEIAPKRVELLHETVIRARRSSICGWRNDGSGIVPPIGSVSSMTYGARYRQLPARVPRS